MKHNGISIKWNLFAYLAGFVAVLLILLWLFQIVFLESFYKAIKTQSIKSSAELIAKNIDSENLQDLLERISQQNGIAVKITDDSGQMLFEATDPYPDGGIQRMPNNEIKLLYEKTKENNGTAVELFSVEPFKGGNHGNFIGRMPPPKANPMQTLLLSKIISKSDGTEVLLLMSSIITPVNATVETLKAELIWITIVLLLLSALLAWFISKKISRPIIKINESAKELARGDYETVFSAKGYREVAELNDTLNYAAKELSKVEGLRRELIANVSHDLRTPLTMITGYAEMMRDIPDENTPENVQIIIDEANRLTELVNDMLDLSKLQSDIGRLTFSDFSLTQSIREILLRYKKLTEQDGYHIKFISGADAYVYADAVKISQVVYNLINNAIHYTGEDKSITVCQSVHDNVVRVEVIDTGSGIKEEEIPYIWERYYKANKSHKRAAVGTGLGLAIVKKILELHQAKYGVISSDGQGSIFWFELQVVVSDS